MPRKSPTDQPELVDTDALPVEAEPLGEAQEDLLVVFLEHWAQSLVTLQTPVRLHAELTGAGIDTVDALASASVGTVTKALRAALGADAQALTGAAARWKE